MRATHVESVVGDSGGQGLGPGKSASVAEGGGEMGLRS